MNFVLIILLSSGENIKSAKPMGILKSHEDRTIHNCDVLSVLNNKNKIIYQLNVILYYILCGPRLVLEVLYLGFTFVLIRTLWKEKRKE